jgi:hypothetical protein
MEKVLKAYRFELVPTKEQCVEFDKQIASCRHTWNALLALDTNKHRNYYISNIDELQDYINNLTKVEELKNSYAKYLVDNPNPTFEQKLDVGFFLKKTKWVYGSGRREWVLALCPLHTPRVGRPPRSLPRRPGVHVTHTHTHTQYIYIYIICTPGWRGCSP